MLFIYFITFQYPDLFEPTLSIIFLLFKDEINLCTVLYGIFDISEISFCNILEFSIIILIMASVYGIKFGKFKSPSKSFVI